MPGRRAVGRNSVAYCAIVQRSVDYASPIHPTRYALRAFFDRSPFGQSREAHTLNGALTLSKECWITAGSTRAEPLEREVRIER